MLGKLKVGDEEAKKIYKRFEAVDKDKSGQIDVEEFFQGLRIEPTSFGERVFKVADVSHDGEIDFGEFFVAVYNFCSFSADSLLNFCFNIFDVDRSGSIERAEVKALVKMMRGSSSKHSAEAADLRGARPTAFRLKIQLGKEADDVASVVPNVCEEGSDSVGVGVDGIDSVDVRWIFHSHDKPYAGVSRFQSIGSTPMP